MTAPKTSWIKTDYTIPRDVCGVLTIAEKDRFRKWLRYRRDAGQPPACIGIYRWLSQGEQKSINARARFVGRHVYARPPELRPANETKGDWDLWTRHRRRGGVLGFEKYCERAKANRARRKGPDFVARYRIPVDQGLKMEVSSILAKFGRMGLLPKKGRP